MKYIIIGGVAGGATAAARIRRNTEQAEIILFEKGEYISYANCGLPYYIGGVIAEREKLFVQTPEAFGKRFNLDVRIRSEVMPSILPRRQWTFALRTGKFIRRVMTNYCFLRVRHLFVLPCRALTMKEFLHYVM